jgi:hypothetical protein
MEYNKPVVRLSLEELEPRVATAPLLAGGNHDVTGAGGVGGRSLHGGDFFFERPVDQAWLDYHPVR